MVRDKFTGWGKYLALGLVITMALFSFYGCSGDDGSAGAPGARGTSDGTLAGTVTFQDFQDNPVNLSGVTVSTSPDQGSTTTAADGTYSLSLPIGNYEVTYSLTDFDSQTETVSIVAGATETADVSLVPTTPVVVQVTASDTSPSPGDVVDISVTVTPVDGSSVTGIQWTAGSVPVVIADDTAASTTVTLPDAEVYKAELYNHVENLNRTVVQAVNPFAHEEAGHVGLTVEVTTTSGTYTGEEALATALPFVVNGGINTVPVGVPVLLHGMDMGDATWTWSIDSQPGSAALDDASSQNPSFIPDAAGVYDISVTNSGALVNSISVYAGTWEGVIEGEDVNGNPTNSSCTGCHNGGIAPDNFTPWAMSGHAEIMTENIDNPAGHWSLSCATCHTVGYNTDAVNNGFDDVAATEGWTAPAHGDPDNWANMLADFPDTAQLANIQCENCHGPQNPAGAHMQGTGGPRISLSSDVCGACHGEPLRHARFQQWEESAHGDFGFVTGHSGSTGCNCHTAGAFMDWAKQGFDPTAVINGTLYGAGQPVTCVVCHPPHDPGNLSGEPNNAKVRVEDDTPELMAGFIATGVGRGATCMLCHSGRRGAFNTTLHPMANGDTTSGELGSTLPHHATQGGILMGENAYFVTVGARGAHSFIADTCTNCHMELEPPPAELSNNQAGTNHTFTASLDICSDCHGAFDGGSLQDTVASLNATMSAAIATALMDDINDIAAQAAGGGVAGAVLYDPSDDVVVDGVIDPDPANGEVGAVITTTNQITAMSLPGRSGRFEVTLTDLSTLSSARTERFKVWVDENDDGIIDVAEVYSGDNEHAGVIDSTITTTAAGVITTHGQDIQMAIWNHGMLYMDGSGGVHNPDFVMDILTNTTAAMNVVIADLAP